MIERSNDLESGDSNNKTVKCSRRDFITKMALFSSAVLASCTPLKVIFKNYPEEYDNNITAKSNNLRAFVATVIPGSDTQDKDLCKIFNDSFYGFDKYCGFFISDLCERSDKMFGKKIFYELTVEQRTDVILSGLEADTTLNKIYSAAIFMSQVSFYSSIYDDEKGCDIIDFKGNTSFVYSEISYKNAELYLAHQITNDGNYS